MSLAKLVCSLKSDLPNEIDFAMQAATVLANSDNFIWSNDYPLVDAICSSLHVYSCVCKDDTSIFSCYCYPRFWHKILDEKSINLKHIQAATLPADLEQSYVDFINLKDHEQDDHDKIYKRVRTAAEIIKQFSLTCGIKSPTSSLTTIRETENFDQQQYTNMNGDSNIQYIQNQTSNQAQQQVPTYQQQPPMNQHNNSQILQNHNHLQPMSSSHQLNITNNIAMMSNQMNQYTYTVNQTKKKRPKSSPSLLKFVSLLLVSKDMPLYLIGLDILSNTASKLSKIPDLFTSDGNVTKYVQMFQQHCINNICCPDGDIYVIIRSIEVVSKLISSSSSRLSNAILHHINESGLIDRIEQLLTSRNDVNLFLAALECCYRISRHQPQLIATGRAQPMTKILVNLLNCEEKMFFMPSALKRIALIGDEETSEWTQLPPPKILAQKTVDSKKIAQMNPASSPVRNNTLATTNNIRHSQIETNKLSPQKSQTLHQPMQVQTQTQTQTQNPSPLETHLPVQIQSHQPVQNHSTLNNKTSQPQDDKVANGLIMQNGLPNGQSHNLTQPTHDHSENHNQAQTNSDQTKAGAKSAQSSEQSQHSSDQRPPQPPAEAPSKEYICQWNTCNQQFTTPKQVYTHVFEVHIGSLAQNELSPCQWTGPNGAGPGCLTKRPKYSLLTHLNDFHCNPAALERALSRSDPIKPPVHPGYGPNAALLAIKRHACNTEKNGSKIPSYGSSPLSVSVRLTAALILRNLAKQSHEMKQALGNHEPLLSEICMTYGRDESKIIAECLSLFSSE